MPNLEFTCDIQTLSEKILEFTTGSETKTVSFGVTIADKLFPVHLHISSHFPNRLTALFNGAVSRERSKDGIVFQRSSWKNGIPSSIISFADPTLVLHDEITIGWGQVDGTLFAPECYKRILDELRNANLIPKSESTLHFGSSAGGFQALATAGYDAGSHVLCNNPQTDFSQYNAAWAANRVLRFFGFENRKEYVESDRYGEYAWRIEIPQLYSRLGYIPKNIRILINTASENDLVAQAGSFVSGITRISNMPTATGYEIYYYYHPIWGHNPLPKSVTLSEIESALARLQIISK